MKTVIQITPKTRIRASWVGDKVIGDWVYKYQIKKKCLWIPYWSTLEKIFKSDYSCIDSAKIALMNKVQKKLENKQDKHQPFKY